MKMLLKLGLFILLLTSCTKKQESHEAMIKAEVCNIINKLADEHPNWKFRDEFHSYLSETKEEVRLFIDAEQLEANHIDIDKLLILNDTIFSFDDPCLAKIKTIDADSFDSDYIDWNISTILKNKDREVAKIGRPFYTADGKNLFIHLVLHQQIGASPSLYWYQYENGGFIWKNNRFLTE